MYTYMYTYMFMYMQVHVCVHVCNKYMYVEAKGRPQVLFLGYHSPCLYVCLFVKESLSGLELTKSSKLACWQAPEDLLTFASSVLGSQVCTNRYGGVRF